MYSENIEKEIIISCLHDEKFLAEVYVILSPTHFNNFPLRWVYWAAKEFFRKYSKSINKNSMINELHKSKNMSTKKKILYRKIIDDLYGQKPKVKSYSKDQIYEYVGDVSFIQALDKASEIIEKGNVDKARKMLFEAILSKQTLKSYSISNWLAEFDTRQAERLKRKNNPNSFFAVRPPYKCLEAVLDGIQPTEVCSITGITSSGKSIMLQDWGACSILRDINVTHITLENSEWQTNQRYDSRILDLPYDTIKYYNYTKRQLEQIERNMKAIKKMIGDRLRVIRAPMRGTTVLTFEQIFRELEIEGFYTGFLIVDYADLMEAVAKFESFRLGQSGIYWDIKAFAVDRNLPLLTATQAPSKYGIADKSGRVPLPTAEATGESYWKARILDIILTLHQTTKQKFMNQIMMYLAKNRDGPRGAEFPLREDFASMRFLDI